MIEVAGDRWVVAGFGPASWVRNARAAGEVTLDEAAAPAAIPVLRTYIGEIKVTRPYFNANPESPDEAIAAELPRHTVFRLTPTSQVVPADER